MIIRENKVNVEEYRDEFMLKSQDKEYSPEEVIFFDLEHYVYKKPKCIGVFGACEYDKKNNSILVTQYMIEDRDEATNILYLARDYFMKMKQKGKKAIITFSGNNDFTVINYLFKENGIYYDFSEEFDSIDIQKEYEKYKKLSIGLKKLEKVFDIVREGEVISGSNLAKTFHKVMKDRSYFKRMPEEKIEKILLYNEQDVINLYYIYVNWKKYIFEDIIIEDHIFESEALEENFEEEVLQELDDYNDAKEDTEEILEDDLDQDY
ncbi:MULTISPECIES: ribonuclease H-like domain-containing protein [unclassified Clostridium]|uniref:ribonuclease H-like domain-containing protein n=1 Tax=unclassified Clostridium TaxID=2614128 RepID=UPI0002973C9C|nr:MULTISPECIES: ribonuclease H-like domain-containing protein [unclassified Clostridium]EKQ53845.1 MAG: putative exonuclease [Clostridium sp. Maddingley MBC34-26]